MNHEDRISLGDDAQLLDGGDADVLRLTRNQLGRVHGQVERLERAQRVLWALLLGLLLWRLLVFLTSA